MILVEIFFSVISCMKQIERTSLISYRTFFGKGQEHGKIKIQIDLTCLQLASKLRNLVSLLKRSFLVIQFKNSTKIDLCLRHFVKTWYFQTANLLCTYIKANYVLWKTLSLRNIQGIFYAGISTYIQSVVRNLVWVMESCKIE